MNSFKKIALALLAFLAVPAAADYYGRTTKPHGHSSNSDGGILGNFYSTGRVGVSTVTIPSVGTAFIVGNGTATFNTDGNITFGRFSRFRARQTSDQPTTSGSDFLVTWATTDFDTLTEFSGSQIFTAKLAGYYEACASVRWSGSGAGARTLRICKNNSSAAVNNLQINEGPSIAGDFHQTLCGVIGLAAADTLRVIVNQTSGSALSVLGSDTNQYFSVWRIP